MVVHSLLVGLDDLCLSGLGDDGESGPSRRNVLRDGHPAEEAEHVLVCLRGVLGQRLLRNLHVVCKQCRHRSQELVAVEHGARQLPLLHEHCGNPVSARNARKILEIAFEFGLERLFIV